LWQLKSLFEFLETEKPTLVHIHYWIRQKDQYQSAALWYEQVFRICEDLKLSVVQNINVPTTPYSSPSVIHNVFVSKFVAENFNRNGGPERSSVIYPGSDFTHFKDKQTEKVPSIHIGMAYRLDQDKLNKESIEVFISIAKVRPNVQCIIIGDGFFLDYYKQRVKEAKVADNFTFTGMVSYQLLPEFYAKFGIFIAPVYDESFGQVVPFAMSMGLCVAGYNTGALSEILGHHETLVETGNVDALAKVVVNLIENPKHREKHGRMNRTRVQEIFSVEQMIKQYEGLYDACIAI
jgi:glycosyltransferase involved in cell wall biosynthesis